MANKGTYAIKKSHNNQILGLHLFMLRSVPKQDPAQIIAYSTQTSLPLPPINILFFHLLTALSVLKYSLNTNQSI